MKGAGGVRVHKASLLFLLHHPQSTLGQPPGPSSATQKLVLGGASETVHGHRKDAVVSCPPRLRSEAIVRSYACLFPP